MPKILINEKDRTSPGTSDSYTNYAVLVAGFANENINGQVKPDHNGVYEFTSAEAFENTIGLIAPNAEVETNAGTTTVVHYGNQMAYELL